MQREFIELLEKNQNIIHKVTNLYAENADDKKDLFQEISFQAWSSYPSFKAESKFSTWLYRVALNTAMTYLKKRKKRTSEPITDERLLEAYVFEDDTKKDQVDFLYKTINQLSNLDKALIILYIDGYDYQEIAHVFGITLSNVGVKINRIKQFLKLQGNKAYRQLINDRY